MISAQKLPEATLIRELKRQYLESLVAPMDGMWETGLTDPCPHWEIRWRDDRAGYFVVNDQGTLLQLYLAAEFEEHGKAVFDHIRADQALQRATVSTIDPAFLSLCLDAQKEVRVHTYLYGLRTSLPPTHPLAESFELRLVEASELDRTIAFQQSCLGGDRDLSGWLRGYSGNLIQRSELFVLCRGKDWLGLGERRRSDSQAGVADLGMMVGPDHRGEGLGTHILSLLVARSTGEGFRPICSTTVENVASQRAITRAGFVSRHRILDVAF